MGTKKKIASLIAAGLMAAPLIATADSVTYDFTGTVTSVAGAYGVAPGATITGTYTIDIANGVPAFSSLPVSATSNWSSEEISGSQFGITSPNSAYVFSSTATVGSVSYKTNPVAGAYVSDTAVYGSPGSYRAVESNQPNSQTDSTSEFSLTNSTGNPYSLSGLPVFSASTTGTGDFNEFGGGGGNPSFNNQLNYNITSLTLAPVPLPAAAWLLVGGLGGLGAFAQKKRMYALA